MKALRNTLISILMLCMLVPMTAYATVYGTYLSDEVIYPTDSLPAFSSYLNNNNGNVILYSSFDEYFYLISIGKASGYNMRGLTADSSNSKLVLSSAIGGCKVYKSKSGSSDWLLSYSADATTLGAYNLFTITDRYPFKIVFCSGKQSITYVDGSSTYYIGTASGNISGVYFDSESGRYLDNDSNNVQSSGGGSSSGSGSVDLTNTNNHLINIKSIVTNIYNSLADFKTSVETNISSIVSKLTALNSSISTMNSNITTQATNVKNAINTMNSNLTTQATGIKDSISNNFTALQTYLTGKYETLYNVIIYGDKDGEDDYQQEKLEIQSQQAKLDSINSRISDAPNSINNAADGLGDYISTFTEFYEGFTALNVAISSILYLSLAFIVIKKIIGR